MTGACNNRTQDRSKPAVQCYKNNSYWYGAVELFGYYFPCRDFCKNNLCLDHNTSDTLGMECLWTPAGWMGSTIDMGMNKSCQSYCAGKPCRNQTLNFSTCRLDGRH